MGLILIASVTSLPELMTGIGSVTLAHEPDLAAGNVFGSCVFNLFILSLIDVRIKQPITSLVKTSHLYAGLFGIILIALSGLAIMLDDITQVLFWISPFSILLVLVYLAAMWGIFQFTQSETKGKELVVFKIITNNEDRQDIAQDIYLKTFKILESFKFQSKLSTWIGQIAYNTCLNYLEKKKLILLEYNFDNETHDQALENFTGIHFCVCVKKADTPIAGSQDILITTLDSLGQTFLAPT